METPINFDPNQKRLNCDGEWNLANIPDLEKKLDTTSFGNRGEIIIDGSAITKMDSAGAWFLSSWVKKLTQQGYQPRLENFSKEHQALLTLVQKRLKEQSTLPEIKPLNIVAKIGKNVLYQLKEMTEFLAFTGKLSLEALRVILNPLRWRWNALAGVIDKNGSQALPIIALLSFMIGVVITYQMGVQLRSYGANIFIVDLLGLSVLREFGPLITAIMIAGRTGSSYTAQLGLMKVNQEVDALDTMGVPPGEILLLPRIIGLVIALPLLTIWADIFGVIGGMVMANNMLNITWYDFLHRFQHVIPLRALIIGLGKAPVFALIISSVGCFYGMQVQGSADSVGKNTTRSVVWGIFFIIVADAIFSIVFSKLKL